MSKIKAILFDMDGVLIEAKDWHYEALNDALALFGYTITREDHLTTFDGLPTRDKLNLISETSYLPKSLHSFINEMKQQYTKTQIELKCKPLFQHEFALSKLKADGYKLAVCSNSIRASIDNMMGKAALTDYLDLIMSNEDVTKGKPDPEIYTTAMKKLGVEPEECLVLEDNKNGIAAALASGAHLLKIVEVTDVNYENIYNRIREIENQ